jgi:hypothetical protein
MKITAIEGCGFAIALGPGDRLDDHELAAKLVKLGQPVPSTTTLVLTYPDRERVSVNRFDITHDPNKRTSVRGFIYPANTAINA